MGHGDHHDEPLDEGHDDDASRGAPPDPMDRIWFHPTELPGLAPGIVAPVSRPSPRRKSRAWAIPVVSGAAGALVTLAALTMVGAFDRDNSTERAGLFPVGGNPAPAASPDNTTRAGLSLVGISVRDRDGMRRGSGVCVRHSGGVLTSARLVGGAETVDVLTSGGEKRSARVVGRDPSTDLVLLAIDEAGVPAAKLADGTPDAGSRVWVLGAQSWVSEGTLSDIDAMLAVDKGPMASGLLETDATTGKAGAGGALIDDDGEVLGIVLARVADSDTTYAMPIDKALSIADELEERGSVAHGSAGFEGVDGVRGPTVTRVVPDGSAARAGVRRGDVVVSVEGRPVESISDVTALVRSDEPGQTLTFELRRGSKSLMVPIELTAAA
jgi:S1-C subfamily serine protease